MKGAAAGQRLGMLVMEPGSLVMERKMLLGIKRARRAACRGRQRPRSAHMAMDGATESGQGPRVDLYWLPLGAGGHFVRLNGRVYERLAAWTAEASGL